MENSFSNSGEGMAGAMLLEDQQTDFYSQVFNSRGPGDEDESEDESDDESKEEEENQGEDKGTDDENPPLDPDIVHSQVTPRSGGKPGG